MTTTNYSFKLTQAAKNKKKTAATLAAKMNNSVATAIADTINIKNEYYPAVFLSSLPLSSIQASLLAFFTVFAPAAFPVASLVASFVLFLAAISLMPVSLVASIPSSRFCQYAGYY